MTTQQPPKKRFFYGWYIIGASMGIQLFFGALMGGIGSLLVPMSAEFGWNKTVFAGAAATRQLESGLLGPFQGWLNDRFGSEILIRIGIVIWGISFMGLSQVNSIPTFYIAFIGAAIGASLAAVQTLTIPIVNWFERKRSLALSLLSTGFSIGGILVPLLAWFMANYGWRPTMFGAGVAIIVVGLPLSLVIKHKPEPHGWMPDGAEAPPPRADGTFAKAERNPKDFTVREAIRTRAFWFISMGHASALVIVSTINLYFIVFLTETMGMSLVEAATYNTMLYVANLIAQIIGGFLGDRFSKRLLSAFCMFGHMAGILLLAYFSSLWAIWLFIILHGTAWGIRGPLMIGIRADYFGRASFGTINGISSGITTIGTITGPLMVGITTDAFGSYRAGFTVLAVVAALGFVWFYLARQPKRPGQVEATEAAGAMAG